MIERQIHLSSGGGAALQGYDGLLRFGYTRNRGIYALRVEADGEWQGMTLRAFWHLPDGNAAPSTLVVDGLVEVPALITAVPGEGRITFEGTDGTRTLTSADIKYSVAMNSGTQAAKEAGNMVDLDNDPTKLIEIVEIGKQLLMTRGTLTTFSIANDVAKYFAIVPALFIASIPSLGALNVMHLHSPESAILSAVIFNALIIILLIPLALRGVRYRPRSTASVLRGNLLVYGLGGVIAPFIGIKLIDMIISAAGLV